MLLKPSYATPDKTSFKRNQNINQDLIVEEFVAFDEEKRAKEVANIDESNLEMTRNHLYNNSISSNINFTA